MLAGALLLLMLVASLAALPVVFLWFLSIVAVDAPFVPVPARAVDRIVDALHLKPGSVVYDMGCGDGRILAAALKKCPEISVVGIEKAFLPYVLAKFRLRGTKAVVRREDFFKSDLSSATHVVLYLFPEVVERLEPKFVRELTPGTKVLTVDFTFKDKMPDEVIELKDKELRRGKLLTLSTF